MPGNSASEGGAGGAGFVIRPIRDGDESEVAELWRASGLVRPWNDPLGDIGSARANASSDIFIAVAGESGGRIAGSVMAGYEGHRGWVYYVAVAPEHRTQGLGERLMRHAEGWLREIGAPKAMLMIREENEAARRFSSPCFPPGSMRRTARSSSSTTCWWKSPSIRLWRSA